jgi:hypothetical protein
MGRSQKQTKKNEQAGKPYLFGPFPLDIRGANVLKSNKKQENKFGRCYGGQMGGCFAETLIFS